MDFETVKSMIADQLKVNPSEIKPESRLMVEDRFGITVEDDQIMKLKTVGDVVNYIAKVKG